MANAFDFGFLGDGWRKGILHVRQVGPLCLGRVASLMDEARKAWDPAWDPEQKVGSLSKVADAANEELLGFGSWEKRQAVIETFEGQHLELPFERAFSRVCIPALRRIEAEGPAYGGADWERRQVKPLEFASPQSEGTADYFALYAPAVHFGCNYGIYFKATSCLDFLVAHPSVRTSDFIELLGIHELFHAFVEECLGVRELYHGLGRSGYCFLEEGAATLHSWQSYRKKFPRGEQDIYEAIFQRNGDPDAGGERGLPGYGEYWRLEGASINMIVLALALGTHRGLDWSSFDPVGMITGRGGSLEYADASGPRSSCCTSVALPTRFPRHFSRQDWRPLWAYYLSNRSRDIVPLYFDFYNL